MNDNPQSFFQKIFGLGGHPSGVTPYAPPAANSPGGAVSPSNPAPGSPVNGASSQPVTQPEPPKKKKNIFQKIFGGGGDKDNKQPQPAQPPQ
jgi:penicillin-binding protein 1B